MAIGLHKVKTGMIVNGGKTIKCMTFRSHDIRYRMPIEKAPPNVVFNSGLFVKLSDLQSTDSSFKL